MRAAAGRPSTSDARTASSRSSRASDVARARASTTPRRGSRSVDAHLCRRAFSRRVRTRASEKDESSDDVEAAAAEPKSRFEELMRRAEREVLIDTASNPLKEIFSVEALQDATESGTRLERVVGAEFVPQAIIEAERKSAPLRRPRLVVYALSASAAAAQLVYVGLEPASFESPVASALSDACVMVIGSLLWRVELQQRADTLRLIWEKAKEREESLSRAEAGLGDTIWTARMRRKAAKAREIEAQETEGQEEEEA